MSRLTAPPRSRLLLLPLLLAAACTEAPPIDPGGGEERGLATVTTFADGVVTGELEVYVHDDVGELRAGYRSGPDGRVTVSVADGWSVTVLDDVEGFRHADTIVGVRRGDDLALGQRGPMRPSTGRLQIAQLPPLAGAARYTVSLCGPVMISTPVDDPAADTTVAYDPHHIDGDGGALLIAEAEVDGERRFALLDAPEVATMPQPVRFGPWQALTTSTATVVAPAAALDVELRLRSVHGCTIGGGDGPGPTLEVSRYPDLPITLASASAWYRRDARQTSRTSRRVAIDGALPPVFDLAAPPPRIDDVVVSVYGSGTVLSWSQTDAPGGDGLVFVLGPAPDLQWTLTAPLSDERSLILPRLPDLPAATAPDWVNINVVDLDDAADFADLAAMSGLPLWDQPGWTTTGTWSR